jgi:hypothetical protein
MKTHGRSETIANVLVAMILGTFMVLFISLPISPTANVTLVESIFGRSENQKEKNVR